MSDVKHPSIVSYVYRYKRPPRKKQAVPLTGPAIVTERTGMPSKSSSALPQQAAPPPANDDRKATSSHRGGKSAIVTTTSQKQLKLRRAERALRDDGREADPEVKAFLARMIRPGGALPPEKF